MNYKEAKEIEEGWIAAGCPDNKYWDSLVDEAQQVIEEEKKRDYADFLCDCAKDDKAAQEAQ